MPYEGESSSQLLDSPDVGRTPSAASPALTIASEIVDKTDKSFVSSSCSTFWNFDEEADKNIEMGSVSYDQGGSKIFVEDGDEQHSPEEYDATIHTTRSIPNEQKRCCYRVSEFGRYVMATRYFSYADDIIMGLISLFDHWSDFNILYFYFLENEYYFLAVLSIISIATTTLLPTIFASDETSYVRFSFLVGLGILALIYDVHYSIESSYSTNHRQQLLTDRSRYFEYVERLRMWGRQKKNKSTLLCCLKMNKYQYKKRSEQLRELQLDLKDETNQLSDLDVKMQILNEAIVNLDTHEKYLSELEALDENQIVTSKLGVLIEDENVTVKEEINNAEDMIRKEYDVMHKELDAAFRLKIRELSTEYIQMEKPKIFKILEAVGESIPQLVFPLN